MIPRVRPRNASVREVLRYLFGPGDGGEHHDQRLVGVWDTAAIGGVAVLQPPSGGGTLSVARLGGLLEQPVLAGNNADLSRARLQGADLHAAKLQGVDLRDAQLQYVNLRGALLQGADLRGARLLGAHLGRRCWFGGLADVW